VPLPLPKVTVWLPAVALTVSGPLPSVMTLLTAPINCAAAAPPVSVSPAPA
jgi:hypothetical protein